MKSFFKSLEIRRRDEIIKETITSKLMLSVKEVQLEKTLENDCYITSVEASNSLCTALEAVFLHGLKERLVDRVSSLMGDPDQRLAPEFWSPVMIFTHRDIINQINKMSQIATDVGKCRAWIRLSLNDGTLISYLEAINQQNKALTPYYKKTAYLRDNEAVTVAVNALQGLTSFKFSYPTNSKFLNVWSNNPLLLAGMWTPPMKDCPVPSGMDIVKSLPDDIPQIKEETPSVSHHTTNYIDEEEALRIILNTPVEGSPLQSQLDLTAETSSSTKKINRLATDYSSGSDNALNTLSERISNIKEEKKEDNIYKQHEEITETITQEYLDTWEEDTEKSDSIEPSQIIPPPKDETLQSYHTVLEEYNPNASAPLEEPSLQEFIQSYEPSTAVASNIKNERRKIEEEDQVCKMGYEVIDATSLTMNIPEFKSMIDQLAKVMQEKGLDSQGFTCKECRIQIGLSFVKARVCELTGTYYCADCFKTAECVIPARVIHNWDFAKYPVSPKSAAFLSEVHDYPLFDIRKLNPRLYFAIEEMAELQKLRMKLNLLRPYLFTCREPIRKDLQKLVWPREYLFEHVHLYSIADLMDIPTGVLSELTKKAINISVEHIKACQLCFQKGFICEICSDSKTIYPFDIDTTYRCPNCRSVFHDKCKKNSKQCPKCYRIQKRKELELELDLKDS